MVKEGASEPRVAAYGVKAFHLLELWMAILGFDGTLWLQCGGGIEGFHKIAERVERFQLEAEWLAYTQDGRLMLSYSWNGFNVTEVAQNVADFEMEVAGDFNPAYPTRMHLAVLDRNGTVRWGDGDTPKLSLSEVAAPITRRVAWSAGRLALHGADGRMRVTALASDHALRPLQELGRAEAFQLGAEGTLLVLSAEAETRGTLLLMKAPATPTQEGETIPSGDFDPARAEQVTTNLRGVGGSPVFGLSSRVPAFTKRPVVSSAEWGIPVTLPPEEVAPPDGRPIIRRVWVTQAMVEEARAHSWEPGPVHITPPPSANPQPRTGSAGSRGEKWSEPTPQYATPNAGKDPTPHNGPTMRSACQWNVLVNAMNMGEAPWGGAISRFENDLNRSEMIRILDQYVGGNFVANFPYCGTVLVNYTFPDPVIIVDKAEFQDILNAAASDPLVWGKWGLGNLYHIFFTSAIKCIEDTYTTDQRCGSGRGPFFGGVYPHDEAHSDPQDWCGQHTYASNFQPGNLYYTIEPYQDYSRCQWFGFPSNTKIPLSHATATTLSHEIFESATDPNPNTGWFFQNYATGEIADLCTTNITTNINTLYDDGVYLNGTNWKIQQEYSIAVHDCTYGPPRIDAFYKGTDSQLWHMWWDGYNWQGSEPLGGWIADTPGVASWSYGRLDVLVQGWGNTLYHQFYENGWSGWEYRGVGNVASGVSAVSWR